MDSAQLDATSTVPSSARPGGRRGRDASAAKPVRGRIVLIARRLVFPIAPALVERRFLAAKSGGRADLQGSIAYEKRKWRCGSASVSKDRPAGQETCSQRWRNLRYDKLVIATGAAAALLVRALSSGNILYLRTLPMSKYAAAHGKRPASGDRWRGYVGSKSRPSR